MGSTHEGFYGFLNKIESKVNAMYYAKLELQQLVYKHVQNKPEFELEEVMENLLECEAIENVFLASRFYIFMPPEYIQYNFYDYDNH